MQAHILTSSELNTFLTEKCKLERFLIPIFKYTLKRVIISK